MALSTSVQMTNAALSAVRTADRVSPALAAGIAGPMFERTRPSRVVHPSEQPVHLAAERHPLPLPHGDGVLYEWGTGPRTVLLVHGWRGRASQFAPIIRELRAAGFHLVAFDAPAHGDAAGRRTDIRSWVEAINRLHLKYGRFEAIIGHSLGALTTMTAVRDGVSTRGVVGLAPMSSGRYLFDAFAHGVGLSEQAAAIQRERYTRRVFPDASDPWRRFDTLAAPLPASVELLLLHDREDREIDAAQSELLHAAHGDRSRMLLSSGSGHVRLLGADRTLDAVTAFVGGGVAAVDRIERGEERSVRTAA
ncbi:alpha/beta fold hydrolase [Agromyces sp. H3Y2-19a]|uniref:alpha/beta hydrolase n=1 Tax=Agromyces TaxID=33877 RepID=UPI0023B8DB99|nr:alpha/beta fold hydrolase [Agromyces chromiiresistens]MDF0513545.1 alpha/beta fold hydrolase [Agromyces chromiiresistens]